MSGPGFHLWERGAGQVEIKFLHQTVDPALARAVLAIRLLWPVSEESRSDRVGLNRHAPSGRHPSLEGLWAIEEHEEAAHSVGPPDTLGALGFCGLFL